MEMQYPKKLFVVLDTDFKNPLPLSDQTDL